MPDKFVVDVDRVHFTMVTNLKITKNKSAESTTSYRDTNGNPATYGAVQETPGGTLTFTVLNADIAARRSMEDWEPNEASSATITRTTTGPQQITETYTLHGLQKVDGGKDLTFDASEPDDAATTYNLLYTYADKVEFKDGS
ncbi:hypothetical protein I5Q34_33815 [Streptomyces sp. AV19]|uniref:hypothetical protein n=1 Tax=Streptomyces sp. AV19 TaxID=2793068 RepID=UPI0018FEB7F1|nr:hypothetical protein [Streptomyces sp. AV19]MBH1939179.1 hypothetical protein [Streptomyces sp. AV19]MDG4536909.1 hypothetical protein [Streptomyces sp. AV19]